MVCGLQLGKAVSLTVSVLEQLAHCAGRAGWRRCDNRRSCNRPRPARPAAFPSDDVGADNCNHRHRQQRRKQRRPEQLGGGGEWVGGPGSW